ncbi:MAG: hypothetical protein PWQ17_2523, partial [Anaerophaga sp.]|nr:hypothetical protein [Anaerophaga sp.]
METRSFQALGFSGDVKLPGTNSDLSYDAFFDVNGTYHFGISPVKNVDFNAFTARMELYSTSRLEVFVENGKFVPTALLDGQITFRTTKSGNEDELINIPDIEFQGMRLSAAPEYFDVEYLDVEGIESCKLVDFPITITGIDLEKRGNLVGFAFDVKANLSPVDGAGITAEGEFSVLANISADSWRFEKLDIGYFEVDASKEGAFTINGRLELFNDDPVYGDAFYGNIDASFANTFSSSGDLKLKVVGMFGNSDFGRYFFVDAFIALGSASVPAPPFIISGFGGGLSYGMKRTFQGDVS